jgi:hypothetical protein
LFPSSLKKMRRKIIILIPIKKPVVEGQQVFVYKADQINVLSGVLVDRHAVAAPHVVAEVQDYVVVADDSYVVAEAVHDMPADVVVEQDDLPSADVVAEQDYLPADAVVQHDFRNLDYVLLQVDYALQQVDYVLLQADCVLLQVD